MNVRGRQRVPAFLLMLFAAACAGTPVVIDTDPAAVSDAEPRAVEVFARVNGLDHLPRAIVRLGAVEFAVVVADTTAARQRGLQGVAAMPDGVGMLFVFPEPSRPSSGPSPRSLPGFWMSEVLLPLDIAFASEGIVVGVATMQPCPERPCPITHPGADYDLALELAAGELARIGVEPGARLVWESVAR